MTSPDPSAPGARDAPASAAGAPRTPPPSFAVAALLAAAVALVYAQVRHFAFVNLDDQQYVTSNAVVLRGLSWDGVAWAFGGFHASNWHPLTWLSHMVDVTLFGADPGAHHLVNVALHAVNAILLFGFLRGATGATWRSAAAAALFAVHPLHVESVAWVSERKDLLSALFFLLALQAWVGWVRHPGPARYLAVAGTLALGLLCKPMIVTFPFVLLLVDVWPLGRLEGPAGARASRARLLGLVREKLPLFALAAASSVVTWVAQSAGDAVATFEAVPFTGRVMNALVSYVIYLARTAWPSGLAAFYPHPVLSHVGIPIREVAAAAALLLGITLVTLREARRRPYLPWGWLWFLGTLVPVIGLAQAGSQGMADRYTYLPLVGVFVAGVWLVSDVAGRLRLPRPAVALGASCIVLALALAARRQASTWRDSLALHERALAMTDRNWFAWNGLGDALSDAGRPAEAIPAYREAIRIEPRLATAWNGLGAAHGRLRAPGDAIGPLVQAVRLRPDYADAWYNLGTAYGSLGQHGSAARSFRSALRLRPDDARAWENLGIASLAAGDPGGARESVEALRRLDPARAARLDAAVRAARPE